MGVLLCVRMGSIGIEFVGAVGVIIFTVVPGLPPTGTIPIDMMLY